MCIYCIYFGLSLVELSLYTNRCCVKLCSYIQSNVPLFLLKEEETSSFFTLSNMSKPKIMNKPPPDPRPTPSLSNLKYNDVISSLRRCVRSSWWGGYALCSSWHFHLPLRPGQPSDTHDQCAALTDRHPPLHT